MLTSKKWKHIHLRPHWDSKCILNSHFGATAGVKGKRSGALLYKSVRGWGGLESPSGCVGRAPPVQPEPRVSRPRVDSGSRWGRECSLREEGRPPSLSLDVATGSPRALLCPLAGLTWLACQQRWIICVLVSGRNQAFTENNVLTSIQII